MTDQDGAETGKNRKTVPCFARNDDCGRGRMQKERATLRPPIETTVKAKLGDSDFGSEVDVLDGVEELDTILHGPLECFAARDEAGAAGALVDDGGGHGFFEVVGTGGSAGVDKAGAAHITVGDLVAAEVDGMIAGKVGVN